MNKSVVSLHPLLPYAPVFLSSYCPEQLFEIYMYIYIYVYNKAPLYVCVTLTMIKVDIHMHVNIFLYLHTRISSRNQSIKDKAYQLHINCHI